MILSKKLLNCFFVQGYSLFSSYIWIILFTSKVFGLAFDLRISTIEITLRLLSLDELEILEVMNFVPMVEGLCTPLLKNKRKTFFSLNFSTAVYLLDLMKTFVFHLLLIINIIFF